MLAAAAIGGLGTDGSARDGGYVDERRSMVLAEREPCGVGIEQQEWEPDRRTPARWPMPPGRSQYAWEAPRLLESHVGVAVDGLPRRVAGFARRNALQALGDSIVPQVAAAILRAWRTAEVKA